MTVAIVASPSPGDIESYAATELRRYIEILFGLTATVRSEPDPGTSDDWRFAMRIDPRLGNQDFVLRRTGEHALDVLGGSDTAVLWAVYELVERWGVTYLLHGDVLPENPGPLRLPDEEIQMSPRLRRRAWRVVNSFLIGPESWPLAEYRRFIDQLAKMKVNRLHFSFWPWQPWVDYAFRGVRKRTAPTNFAMRLPIDEETIGRELFGNVAEFDNLDLRPDLQGSTRYEDRVAAAQHLAREAMRHGKARGMTSSIAAQVTAWTKDFHPLFPGSTEIQQLGRLTFGRAEGQAPDDPAMIELARAALRGHFAAYPDADIIFLGAQEQRHQLDQYDRCFQRLDRKSHLSEIRTLEETLRLAAARTKVVGGGAAREISRVKGDLIALYFLDQVLADPAVLERAAAPPIQIGYIDFADELIGYLGRLEPRPSETMNFVDYTAGTVLEQRETLDLIPTDPPANLIFTLADDNVGIMPQLTSRSLVELTGEIARRGWHGFSTRYWMIGDLDPTAACISRAAWDEHADADAITREQIRRVCGPDAVDPLAEALAILEEITLGFDSHGIGFGFPVEGLLMKHWDGEPLDDAFKRDRDQYAQAGGLAQRALERSRPAGREYARYYVGRFAFAVGYLDCVDLVHQASVAEAAGDRESAIARTREALHRLRHAIEAWVGIARDASDRGAIATLNQMGYRRLGERLKGIEDGREVSGIDGSSDV